MLMFAEQPPSKQWAALKYRGEKFAEVWFKPAGEPFGLTFRIPQQSFHLAGLGTQLTLENLLKAVAIAADTVASWRVGDQPQGELKSALPPPSQDVAHLEIHVRLRPPQEEPGPTASSPVEVSLSTWQDLEARWKAILGVEVAMDVSRKSLESVMVELENSVKKALTAEEKTHAQRADVTQWERARTRVHHVVPKVKEAIHRVVWSLGAPERKRLEELYKDHIQPHIPFPQMGSMLLLLENLLKDRQVLAAHAQTVYQEGRGIATEVQGALKTLQNNAATNAQKKKNESKGGKFFKSVRKMSGA